jgi:hypothetical protein
MLANLSTCGLALCPALRGEPVNQLTPLEKDANSDYVSACVSVVGSGLHLCLANCFLRLSCASATLLSAVIGTLNSRLQKVQTPTVGTVPSHLMTLRLRVAIGEVTVNFWVFRRCGHRALGQPFPELSVMPHDPVPLHTGKNPRAISSGVEKEADRLSRADDVALSQPNQPARFLVA